MVRKEDNKGREKWSLRNKESTIWDCEEKSKAEDELVKTKPEKSLESTRPTKQKKESLMGKREWVVYKTERNNEEKWDSSSFILSC